jgi:bifunctional glutamyl/prolyl-tRNA synthetase
VPAASAAKKKSDTKKSAEKPVPAKAQTETATTKEPQLQAPGADLTALSAQIQAQGEKVRSLKEVKADKAAVGAEVKTLLDLKASYKAAAGKDWTPEATKVAAASAPAPAVNGNGGGGAASHAKVASQGDLVRKLKAEKAAKADIDEAVKTLLGLKLEYKAATGQDWKPEPSAGDAVAKAAPKGVKKEAAAAPVKAASPPVSGNGGGFQRMT